MPNWLKIIFKVIGALVALLVILLITTSLYISTHKAKVLALINAELNKNIDGKFIIGDMQTSFFKGFPGISLSLKNVLIKDKKWPEHHRTLLDAKNFGVSLNAAALLRGTVNINHIDISQANIDLYTDSNGYSNTSVFKKSDEKKNINNSDGSGSSTEISKFSLEDVTFTLDNKKVQKLLSFQVDQLYGKLSYVDTGWAANVHLDVLSKSLAFNTHNGSFIKNTQIIGDLTAGSNDNTGKITAKSTSFYIGGAPFTLNTAFETKGNKAGFKIHVASNHITWRHASSLVAANISETLNRFNIDKPIAITAKIEGIFSGGDPYLYITAKVVNSQLTIPGGVIDDCNFDGIFTNSFVKNKAMSDTNSIIKLIHLSGNYNHLPFTVDTGSIINLQKPYATGNFRSSFPVANLNYLLGNKVAKFTNGTADMHFRYTADVVDYRINKPMIKGVISVKNADINYVPRNVLLRNTSLSLNFTGDDLILSNIRVQSGKSIVLMEGRINNFLNLYYSAPEKILLTWQIKSPQLYLGEFLSFFNSRQQTKRTNTNSGNVVDQLSNVLDKGRAEMHIKVEKVYYKQFLATNANADLIISEDGVVIKDINVNHAGGSLKMNGDLIQGAKNNKFLMSAIITNVNIREFFRAFDNFGLKAISYQNLTGFLSAKTQIKGMIDNAGGIVPKSIDGMAVINLKNGALINYNPLKTVGKFAFPFRDLNNIRIPVLDARFDIHGDKIIINPMKITSSVLNMDVAGTYGLTNGTDIALDVPLRNPKGDSTIADKAALDKKRYKGIVLHILAKDDETGKLKIGWNKNHK